MNIKNMFHDDDQKLTSTLLRIHIKDLHVFHLLLGYGNYHTR